MTRLQSIQIEDNQISYDRHGDPSAPSVVLLTGWCQDHRLFDPLLGQLTDLDVLRIDWRGHGPDRRSIPDFGAEEQAADTIAVLDQLGVDEFLPLSTSHGGWANLELAQRAGKHRVPALIVIDWIMTEAGEEFLDSLRASQDPNHWQAARDGLFDLWVGDSGNALVQQHLEQEMGAFGYEMWALSCRVIERSYRRWGSPLRRMTAMAEPPAIRHLYSQPTAAAYARAQDDFAASHPWFSHRRLQGRTHFPTLESPARVAEEIRRAVVPLG